jgi:gamma-glutamylcyclotransferase (GGCT)/AIG2-like uncharacterized protein YtfP
MTNRPFFVYGTLRPGQGNYRLLAGRTVAEFPATLPGHALYGPGLPYVTAGEEDWAVVGDLIFVASERYGEVLAGLDCLEGYRPGSRHCHYEREARTVRYVDADGAEATSVAWVYLAGPAVRERLRPAERIPGGDWLEAELACCGR